MNPTQQEGVIKALYSTEFLKKLNDTDFIKFLKREFDRSFDISIAENSGRVKISFKEQDTGLPVMTIGDVAVFLQTDRASVRRMTGERAQQRSKHPIPFVKIGGKMLRFSRPAIEKWWAELCADGKNDAPTLRKSKQKH